MDNVRIMDHIEEHAIHTPDAPAIMNQAGKMMSYSELSVNVSNLSDDLASCGVNSDNRIAVIMPKAFEMAVLYLAVSNVAAFVPLSADFPKEQFEYYFKILNIDALIIWQEYDPELQDIAREMSIDCYYLYKNNNFYSVKSGNVSNNNKISSLMNRSQGNDTAIVLFTSGTTGKPKIVPRSHINSVSSAFHRIADFTINRNDRGLIFTAMDRAASLNMLLTTLISGGCAICADKFEPSQMFHLIKEKGPTWFAATPIIFQTIIEYADENNIDQIHSNLRFVTSSGAPISDSIVDRISQLFQVTFYNNYGLTETGWLATTANEPKGHKVGSVGIVDCNNVGIMDSKGTLIGKNTVGEIVARGPQVIKGYDNGKKINEDSFFGDWFRTGDSGYLDDDGYLFITGRIKELINRGGEKISPYEVEETILKHPSVLQCVVFPIKSEEGYEEAGAAVVLKEGACLYLKDLRRFLSGKVVAFKMPTRLYVLPEIPISDAGKVQRQKIYQEIIARGIDQQPEYAANEEIVNPRNHTEIVLDKIFKKILPVKKFSITDTFFELGGDSLRAAVLYEQIQKAFKLQIPLKYIFKNGSIEKLAEYIENHNKNAALRPFLVPFQEEGTKDPIFFVHGAEGEAAIYRYLADNFDPDRPFYAISFNTQGADWKHPITFEQIARHYIKDIRSVRPNGPYILAGQCVGGVIAYEMAVQLRKSGQEIGLLAMYDSIIHWPEEPVDLKDKLVSKFDEVKNNGKKAVLNLFALKFNYYRSRLLTVLYGKSPYLFKSYIFHLMNKDNLINYALSGYKIKQYDGEIVFFKPENNTRNISQATVDILAESARTIRIVPIRGGHSTVFYEENADNTRQVLENILADIS